VKKPIVLQLILNDTMVNDASYRRDLLNWITRFDELDGVYIIQNLRRSRKQLYEIETILNMMDFLIELKNNDLYLILGYLNLESILYLFVQPDVVTVGSYENLRIFKLDTFSESGSPPYPPNPRLFFSSLMQIVDYNYFGAIRRHVDDADAFFDHSKYNMSLFVPSFDWHFQKKEPYLHYFETFTRKLERYISLKIGDRYNAVIADIEAAQVNYRLLEHKVRLGEEDLGYHLSAWLTILSECRERIGF
jgi:hypothetical protein